MVRVGRTRALVAFSFSLLALLGGSSLPAQNPAIRTVHVFVALADNQNQGIVPVPPRLGNGLDPAHNLYWGAAAGVKTFFARSPDWLLVFCTQNPTVSLMERCVFKHRRADVYLVADDYRGDEIRQAILTFFDAAAGASPEMITLPSTGVTLSAHGGSQLLGLGWHDGVLSIKLPHRYGKKKKNYLELTNLPPASSQ